MWDSVMAYGQGRRSESEQRPHFSAGLGHLIDEADVSEAALRDALPPGSRLRHFEPDGEPARGLVYDSESGAVVPDGDCRAPGRACADDHACAFREPLPTFIVSPDAASTGPGTGVCLPVESGVDLNGNGEIDGDATPLWTDEDASERFGWDLSGDCERFGNSSPAGMAPGAVWAPLDVYGSCIFGSTTPQPTSSRTPLASYSDAQRRALFDEFCVNPGTRERVDPNDIGIASVGGQPRVQVLLSVGGTDQCFWVDDLAPFFDGRHPGDADDFFDMGFAEFLPYNNWTCGGLRRPASEVVYLSGQRQREARAELPWVP